MKLNLAIMAIVAGTASAVAPAQARVFDFTFAGIENDDSGSGQIVASGSGPDFTVTGVTGTISVPALSPTHYTITGSPSSYAGADNILYFPPATSEGNTTVAFVDFGGISFHTSAGADFNFGGQSQSGPFAYVLNNSTQNPVGYPNVVGSDLINFTVSAPELSTWAMLLLGFLGLGFAGYRARSQAVIG